jgi:hypothetical protein
MIIIIVIIIINNIINIIVINIINIDIILIVAIYVFLLNTVINYCGQLVFILYFFSIKYENNNDYNNNVYSYVCGQQQIYVIIRS